MTIFFHCTSFLISLHLKLNKRLVALKRLLVLSIKKVYIAMPLLLIPHTGRYERTKKRLRRRLEARVPLAGVSSPVASIQPYSPPIQKVRPLTNLVQRQCL